MDANGEGEGGDLSPFISSGPAEPGGKLFEVGPRE